MEERAVVGEQEQSGGVFVETADALHAARHQGLRQQGEYAGMMQRSVRAFIAGWLVQGKVGVLAIAPALAVDDEVEGFGRKIGVGIQAWRWADLHLPGSNQFATSPARAETLAVENAFEVHGEGRNHRAPQRRAARMIPRRPQTGAHGTPCGI